MNRTYIKLVRYFIFLIITTCLASLVLFFLTLGYPMSRDFHQQLRKHAVFIATITKDRIDLGISGQALAEFLDHTAQSYGAKVTLFDRDLSIQAVSKLNADLDVVITQKMLADIREKGIFVQPSHFQRPLIYALPVKSSNGLYYIHITKTFSRAKRTLIFISGLFILCGLLIVAIYPLAKSFTKPLRQLTHAVNEIGAGNLKPDIKVGSGDDELGDLLSAFSEMARSVDIMVESRKELLADISHELRSPLGRLSINAELIKPAAGEQATSDDLNRYVENIEYEIAFMDTLLRQLSDYSVLNLPGVKMDIKPLDASDLLREIYSQYQPVMEKKNLRFSIDIHSEKAVFKADQGKIKQVFNNLIDNAANACPPEGEICLGLKVFQNQVVCSVANTGPRIPSHIGERMFDPLFRGDPSRNRKTGGAGLGLAISKKIIEHHKGNISWQCEDNKTIFSVCLDRVVDVEKL